MNKVLRTLVTAYRDKTAPAETRHLAYDALSAALEFKNTNRTVVLGTPTAALLPTGQMKPDESGVRYMMPGHDQYSGATLRRNCGSHMIPHAESSLQVREETGSGKSWKSVIPVEVGLHLHIGRSWSRGSQPHDKLLVNAEMLASADPHGYRRPQSFPLVHLVGDAKEDGATVSRLYVGDSRVPVTPQSLTETLNFFGLLSKGNETTSPLVAAQSAFACNDQASDALGNVERAYQTRLGEEFDMRRAQEKIARARQQHRL